MITIFRLLKVKERNDRLKILYSGNISDVVDSI